ncbi:MAG: hypothetical protein ACERKN_10085 [Velocimicrobium sp.]
MDEFGLIRSMIAAATVASASVPILDIQPSGDRTYENGSWIRIEIKN